MDKYFCLSKAGKCDQNEENATLVFETFEKEHAQFVIFLASYTHAVLFDVHLQIILSERGIATMRTRGGLFAGVPQVVPPGVGRHHRRVSAHAAEVQGRTVFVTYEPSPEQAGQPSRASLRNSDSLGEKINLIQEYSVGHDRHAEKRSSVESELNLVTRTFTFQKTHDSLSQ